MLELSDIQEFAFANSIPTETEGTCNNFMFLSTIFIHAGDCIQ